MEEKLALNGGTPVRALPHSAQNTLGPEETAAALRVMESKVLSDFLGRAGDKFLGGREVLAFESACREKFNVAYAVAFNSATTALEAAVAALELEAGSEVLVAPYTMTASVTAIIVNNLVPVFVDIDKNTYCIDANEVEKKITGRTKAIMAVDLFGGSPDFDKLLEISKKHNLKIIEDTAQGSGGTYKGKTLGTIADMGVFSFNVHKTIQAGEGGVLVTNNKDLAFRAELKRNHGENITDDLQILETAIVGSNFRMSELHAAVCAAQLKKLDMLNDHRIRLTDYLTQKLASVPGLTPHTHPVSDKHVYYIYPFVFNAEVFGTTRELFAKAMRAEGFPLGVGYVKPIYRLNLFKNPKVFASWPFLRAVNIQDNLCPVTERLYDKDLLTTDLCHYPLTEKDVDEFISAIIKIKKNVAQLKIE